MKDKLKAIWRILRAKSYFYTVRIGDSFVSDYEIGNQPKTPLPAHIRVDIMFAEIDKLAIIARDHIKRMVTRSCPDCKNWGTIDCPNSDKCFSLPSHPYFTPKNKKQ